MAEPLHLQVAHHPATSGISALCVGIFFWLHHKRVEPRDVGLSYELLVQDRQWWRVVTAQVSHFDLIHLVMNVSSLWGMVEAAEPAHQPGASLEYLRVSVLLMLGSAAVIVGLTHGLVRGLRLEAAGRTVQVGYSCVLFGWLGLLAFRRQGSPVRFNIVGFATVPMWLVPFLLLAVTQVLVPNASFLGHLSGLLTGLLLATGCLDWLTPYWSAWLFVWAALGICYSLVREGRLGRSYIRLVPAAVSEGPEELDGFEDAFDRIERATMTAPGPQAPGGVSGLIARAAAAVTAVRQSLLGLLGSRRDVSVSGRRDPEGLPLLSTAGGGSQPLTQWQQQRYHQQQRPQPHSGRLGQLSGAAAGSADAGVGAAAAAAVGAGGTAGAGPGVGGPGPGAGTFARPGPTTAAAGPALPWGAALGGRAVG